MPRSPVTVRAISDAEADVIERVLAVAATDASVEGLIEQVRALQVIGRCDCGCASVEFCRPAPGQMPRIVADVVAESPDGEGVGLIVWALDNHLSGLEVYSDSDRPAPLPVVGSISCCNPDSDTRAAKNPSKPTPLRNP